MVCPWSYVHGKRGKKKSLLLRRDGQSCQFSASLVFKWFPTYIIFILIFKMVDGEHSFQIINPKDFPLLSAKFAAKDTRTLGRKHKVSAEGKNFSTICQECWTKRGVCHSGLNGFANSEHVQLKVSRCPFLEIHNLPSLLMHEEQFFKRARAVWCAAADELGLVASYVATVNFSYFSHWQKNYGFSTAVPDLSIQVLLLASGHCWVNPLLLSCSVSEDNMHMTLATVWKWFIVLFFLEFLFSHQVSKCSF